MKKNYNVFWKEELEKNTRSNKHKQEDEVINVVKENKQRQAKEGKKEKANYLHSLQKSYTNIHIPKKTCT